VKLYVDVIVIFAEESTACPMVDGPGINEDYYPLIVRQTEPKNKPHQFPLPQEE